ncbi:MAG: hypothetical protein LGR52_02995 [Candidatus Thiosymbion ectosymbiont of Robbea hypermnestra]|nr:hypothetical protein [Candidatus Thiosymbion ectosymbiont of Robbea hypermnestra]
MCTQCGEAFFAPAA